MSDSPRFRIRRAIRDAAKACDRYRNRIVQTRLGVCVAADLIREFNKTQDTLACPPIVSLANTRLYGYPVSVDQSIGFDDIDIEVEPIPVAEEVGVFYATTIIPKFSFRTMRESTPGSDTWARVRYAGRGTLPPYVEDADV